MIRKFCIDCHLENCNWSVCLTESNLQMQLPSIINCRYILWENCFNIENDVIEPRLLFYGRLHLNWFQLAAGGKWHLNISKRIRFVFLVFRIFKTHTKKLHNKFSFVNCFFFFWSRICINIISIISIERLCFYSIFLLFNKNWNCFHFVLTKNL